MEDENRNPSTSYSNLRPKKPRSFDEVDSLSWDCSVCTYKNNAEAFKCAICDTRKGTSTRKPKVNSQLVAQQTAQQLLPTPAKIQKTANPRRNPSSHKRSFSHSRIKNVDQNSEQQLEVTVGDVTVIITDYKLLPVKDEKSPPASPSQQETTVKDENEQIIPPVFEEKVENGEKEEKAVEINT
ncbi:YY1-associated factor 2-like isoform X2 [Rhopilema esculentum]|uniref:YY1-associated factor 2-like isoform X2 n=1 Tax=Rhopilema esculentum TaxID=499914 RepID=UPI0031D841B4